MTDVHIFLPVKTLLYKGYNYDPYGIITHTGTGMRLTWFISKPVRTQHNIIQGKLFSARPVTPIPN